MCRVCTVRGSHLHMAFGHDLQEKSLISFSINRVYRCEVKRWAIVGSMPVWSDGASMKPGWLIFCTCFRDDEPQRGKGWCDNVESV